MLERESFIHPITGSLAAVFLMLLLAGVVSHVDRYHSMPPIVQDIGIDQKPAEGVDNSADLKVQKNMANAAWAAVWVGAAGLVGLLFTVRYALLTWKEAQRSATADEESLALTRLQLKDSRDVAARQSRCYIEPVGGKFIRPDPDKATLLTDHANIMLNCVNHGGSIGKNIYCLYEVEVIDLDASSGTLRWREFEPQFRSDHPNVAPNSEFSISLDLNAVKQVDEVPFDGRHLAVVRGAVYYRDVFDDRFRSGFVLIGLIPFNSGLVAREIPFGMSRSSEDRPIFEFLEPA